MKRKLAAIVNNRSLQTRMVVLCLLIAVISTALMAFFSYSRASAQVQAQAYKRAEDTVGQTASYVDQRLRNVLGQVYSLATGATEAFRDVAFDDGGLTNTARVASFSRLQSVFAGLRVRDSLILNAYLYTPYREYYELIFQPAGNIEASRIFSEVQQNRLENRWLSPRRDEIFSDAQPVIPLVVPINYSSGQNNLVASGGAQNSTEFGKNFLVVNLNQHSFIEYLQGLKPASQSLVYIAAPDGQAHTVPGSVYQDLLRQTDFQARLRQADGSQGFFEYEYAGQTLFVNYAAVETSDWKIVSLQPKAELLAGLGDIQRYTLLVGLICLALSLGLSSWLAASITRPIGVLKQLMRRVEERDFSGRFPSRYKDEIGQLGHAFNSMTEEIDSLLHKVEQEQHAKRLAELEALQAQINPHFLYNTLDSIYWKALMKENEAVSEMAVSLSNLFRLGLNGGRELTTLGKELEHVRNYLEIQKLCYGETFSYTIKSDPALGGISIVKLILQPLVENSLTHGFELMQANGYGPGWLELEAIQDPASQRICLRVSDNGRGFDTSTLQASLDEAESHPRSDKTSGHGYALRNVHARLRLHYGDGYELKLFSQPYQRNSVEIWIPLPFEVEPTAAGEMYEAAENNPPVEQKSPINSFN